MASMAELELRLTGGASNSDVTVSTGGIVSSTEIIQQTGTGLTTLSGVTIERAMGNAEGDGTLTWNSSAETFTWTPKNGTTGTAVSVTADGTYFIQGGSDGGALVITVVYASLPTSTTSNTVTVANNENVMFDDVSKDDSYAGITRYHIFAFKNTGTDAKKDVKLWINANTPGQDTINIGISTSVTAGDGATTGLFVDTTDETSAPAETVSYVAPTTEATAIDIGELSGSAGSTHTRQFVVKQIVPSNVDEEYLDNNFTLAYSARV